MSTPESETAAKAELPASSTLDEVMLAMDVVDTLRHRERLVERELNEDVRDEQLIARLRELYGSQGIEVPDRIIKEGVEGLKESRFVYTPPPPSLARTLAVTDAAGKRVTLSLAGVRRSGDLLWVTLRTPPVLGRVGVRLTNRVLFERYDDQVNVVQTSVAGRRRTLLFTKRDGAAAKSI